MRILSVAFPFAPVRPDCAGGAEQMVLQVHRALRARGPGARLIACASSAAGPGLLPVPDPGERIDACARALQHAAVRAALAAALAAEPAHVVHFHGVDCASYLPEPAPFPAAVTLHLPADRYPPALLRRADVRLCAVSEHQARTLRTPRPVRVLPNGVDLSLFRPRGPASGPVLFLGRLCPEKAPHLAIDAARAAGARIRVAGTVHPYLEHVRYWREEIVPRLGPDVELLGAVGGRAKAELIASSRALVLPCRSEETSSLAAMEALACGVPVVALARGALPEIVDHGRTGLLVDRPEDLGTALAGAPTLDRSACRRAACERFALERSIEAHLALYRELVRAAPRGAPRRRARAGRARPLAPPPAPRGAARSLRSLSAPGEGELDVRALRFSVFGLTVSSSWGNGHATLWRGLIRALGRRGHRVTFFEWDAPWYAPHRDLGEADGLELVLYPDWEQVLPVARERVRRSDVTVVTSYCPDALRAQALAREDGTGLRIFYDLDSAVTLGNLAEGVPVEYVGPDGYASYHLVLSYTGGRALEMMRDVLGARRVAPLYGWADPDRHFPVEPEERLRSALSFLGTYAPDRQRAFERLFLEPARALPERRFVLGGS
ncbi:MAG TPA: glycosyltransferase, partial [Longimicrobiales bacterium]|nr:glycosyltransferase [Longimicrobiales bacterium]